MSRSPWPGFRPLMLIVGWVFGVFLIAAWRSYWALSQAAADGVAAVSFDFKRPALLALAFGPPLLLIVAGVLLRRRFTKERR